MKAKDKARELVDKYSDNIRVKFQEYAGSHYTEIELSEDEAKQCALICVDELIKNAAWKNESYYKEVKQEIENL